MDKSMALMKTDFDTLQRMSLALYKSNYFKDVQSEAQAIVKVMAGAELGLPPFASMAGIHIIQGKPVLSSNVMATLVENHPRYSYKVLRCDNESCIIAWHRDGKAIGQSAFTWNEAKGAGLTGKESWKKYPSDMLFARAISRGARRFAPGIFGGTPVYTPDELGADVDEDGYIVKGKIVTVDSVWETVPDIAPDPQDFDTETDYQKAVAEFEGTTEPLESPANGNGPKFENQLADARAWLEEKISNSTVKLGLVADALCMTGLYNDREHFKNWITGDKDDKAIIIQEYLEKRGLPIDFRRAYPGTLALKIFDAGLARKVEESAAE